VRSTAKQSKFGVFLREFLQQGYTLIGMSTDMSLLVHVAGKELAAARA